MHIYVVVRGLHGPQAEAQTRPVSETVWPDHNWTVSSNVKPEPNPKSLRPRTLQSLNAGVNPFNFNSMCGIQELLPHLWWLTSDDLSNAAASRACEE